MAELMLKVDAGGGYDDGDVICAFSDERISWVHAEHLSHIKNAPPTRGNRKAADSLAAIRCGLTYQYRFDRNGTRSIVRTHLKTNQQVEFNDQPQFIDGVWQAIDVPLFLARQLQYSQCAIFGEPGAEFWFGGDMEMSAAALTATWDAIEGRTGRRRDEPDHTQWPATPSELRHHLMLRVDANFTRQREAELESSEIEIEADADGNPILDESGMPIRTLKQKRLHDVPIARLGLSVAERNRVRDKTQPVDLRSEKAPFATTVILREKPRLGRLTQDQKGKIQ